MILADLELVATPSMRPPAAHRTASLTSLARPVLQRPSTRTGCTVVVGDMTSTMADTERPCQLLCRQSWGSASPGSSQSASRPSPSIA